MLLKRTNCQFHEQQTINISNLISHFKHCPLKACLLYLFCMAKTPLILDNDIYCGKRKHLSSHKIRRIIQKCHSQVKIHHRQTIFWRTTYYFRTLRTIPGAICKPLLGTSSFGSNWPTKVFNFKFFISIQNMSQIHFKCEIRFEQIHTAYSTFTKSCFVSSLSSPFCVIAASFGLGSSSSGALCGRFCPTPWRAATEQVRAK